MLFRSWEGAGTLPVEASLLLGQADPTSDKQSFQTGQQIWDHSVMCPGSLSLASVLSAECSLENQPASQPCVEVQSSLFHRWGN